MTLRGSIQITFAILALAGYLVATVFVPFHMAHAASVDMPMSNCPYTIGQHSVCSMDAIAHLQSWHEYTSAPFAHVELFLVIIFIFIPFLAIELLTPLRSPHLKRLRIIPLYQSLFSDGILHSKAP